jgi:predicted ABC-type ATPase
LEVSRLIVYAGPNGAGKSTLRDIGGDDVDVVIDPDRIARDLAPAGSEAVQIEAGRAAILLMRRCIAQRRSMSLETTLAGNTIIRRIYDAKLVGYEIWLRFVALKTALLHVDRVRQRVRKGGHDIPRDTILRRYENSLDNLPRLLGFVDHAIIADNSGRQKKVLLRCEAGVILERAENPPSWFAGRWPAIEAALAGRVI